MESHIYLPPPSLLWQLEVTGCFQGVDRVSNFSLHWNHLVSLFKSVGVWHPLSSTVRGSLCTIDILNEIILCHSERSYELQNVQ